MTEIFTAIKINDIIDILIVAYVVYRILLALRGTRAIQMIIGLFILLLVSLVAQWAQLGTIRWILLNFWTIWVLAIIVLFQPELRRALAQVGQQSLFEPFHRIEKSSLIEETVRAVVTMASKKIGALIVIEGETKLQNYLEAGVNIGGKLSRELLLSIFNTRSPLHDGAVIIRDGSIAAAGCFLPLTQNPHIKKEWGTRHRAAIGLTEETDAIVIVISEEQGNFAIARGGKMSPEMDVFSLRRTLEEIFTPSQKQKQKEWKSFLHFRRKRD